jgi:hypothetical protein
MDITGLGSVADLVGKVVSRTWPDKTQLEQNHMAEAFAIIQNQLAIDQGQMEINKAEAESSSLFKGGWRPFLGWVCASACAWNWIGLPVTKATMSAFNLPALTVSPADLSQMLPLLLGMLGLGTLRTYEKTQGVASK